MELLESSNELVSSLEGKVLKEFSGIRYVLDVGSPENYSFVYCLCCYALIEDIEKPLKIFSIETDTAYSVYAELIEYSEYDNRSSDLSDNMFYVDFERYKNLKINRRLSYDENGDVLGVGILFGNNLELYLVSGEHYKDEGQFCVVGPDEMLLVFERLDDVKKYGLLPTASSLDGVQRNPGILVP